MPVPLRVQWGARRAEEPLRGLCLCRALGADTASCLMAMWECQNAKKDLWTASGEGKYSQQLTAEWAVGT